MTKDDSVSILGEGPPFTLKTEEVEEHSIHCNKKKKDAKTADVRITH